MPVRERSCPKWRRYTIEKTLTEDDLYKLELDAFMRLIESKETQDRIKHTFYWKAID